MRAVFLYDRTGIMAKPWLDNGYECWCFDGQHEEGVHRDGNLIKVGVWFDAYNTKKHVNEIKSLVGSADIVVGFPECTDLAVSGAAHFSKKLSINPSCQAEASELARMVMYVGDALNCPWVAENPVSVLSTIWRKPDYSFHPYEYGGYLPENDEHPLYPEYTNPRDSYPKKTCLWAGNGFVMPSKRPVDVDLGYSNQYKKLGGKSKKTKNIRSATPRGFANAVFDFNGCNPDTK